MRVHRWKDIRKGKMSAKELAEVDRRVEQTVLELQLREMRRLVGKTQAEIAAALKMSQGHVSETEQREDHRLSTLRRYVEALGGELEVVANFGDKRIRLRGV